MSKTWFITGTSSGFGRLMTESLLARGDRVAATLRKVEILDDLKVQHGERLWVTRLDVTDATAIRRVVDQAFQDLGRIDVVVNNAAYGLVGAAEELTDDQVRLQIDTNLVGSIQVIRAALPHLREQGGGHVLQLSSEGGQIAYPAFSLYHATKWGIEGFVEAVAQEVAPFGITFTLAEPGPTRTDFGAKIVSPPALAAYNHTPVGEVRRMVAGRAFPFSEPQGIVNAMIASVDQDPVTRRLVMGDGAYSRVRATLVERLSALDAQKDIALAVDSTG
jgi:NAD(P)-dependent dehydrogenase (short-subunit alcohol dehydrogenase family)